ARIEAELGLAELEVDDNQIDAAMKRYDAMMADTTSQPTRQRIALGAAQALMQGGKVQEAEARYRALLDTAKGEVADQCEIGLARAAELRGYFDEAERGYQAIGTHDGPWAVESLFAL